MYIPFCPVPVNKAKKLVGKTFYSVSEKLIKIFPNIENDLKQANFDISARDYMSIAVFSSLFMFVMTFLPFSVLAMQVAPIQRAFPMGLLIGFVFFFVTFFYIKTYPKLIIKKELLISKGIFFTP